MTASPLATSAISNQTRITAGVPHFQSYATVNSLFLSPRHTSEAHTNSEKKRDNTVHPVLRPCLDRNIWHALEAITGPCRWGTAAMPGSWMLFPLKHIAKRRAKRTTKPTRGVLATTTWTEAPPGASSPWPSLLPEPASPSPPPCPTPAHLPGRLPAPTPPPAAGS